MVRKQVLYSGLVQGVNFRANTVRVAEGFDVSGYVRNLPDGRVECVVEGEPDEVDRFLDEMRKRMSRFIEDTEEHATEATGEFDGFTIRR